MCSDFLLLNVRSCRYKYYTSAVKELWMVFDTPPAAAKEREAWGIPPNPRQGLRPWTRFQKLTCVKKTI
jgi:hypothetical protein